MQLRYFSHSAFQLTSEAGHRILIDPFLDDNPTSPVSSGDVNADFIVLTHAHGDHLGDTFAIASRCNATVIAVNELANYCAKKGLSAHNMHIGGGCDFPFGHLQFTIAHHGSSTPEGEYAGEPAGVILTIDGKTIYHTGDTGLFLDMKLIGEIHHPDCMLVAIGDNFTMGIRDAVKAVELTCPGLAIPMHYNTFPAIEADPHLFVRELMDIGRIGKVLEYGAEIVL